MALDSYLDGAGWQLTAPADTRAQVRGALNELGEGLRDAAGAVIDVAGR